MYYFLVTWSASHLGPKKICVGNFRVSEWIKLQNTLL